MNEEENERRIKQMLTEKYVDPLTQEDYEILGLTDLGVPIDVNPPNGEDISKVYNSAFKFVKFVIIERRENIMASEYEVLLKWLSHNPIDYEEE
tara:strand:+ start:656 stop:937 length:282 start_codon:yes stop_codon:yes gene_type:complete